MTTLMPIQSAAIFQVDQVRSLIVVGARSLFQSGLLETSVVSSTKSRSVVASGEEIESSIDVIWVQLLESEAYSDLRRD